MHRYGATPGEGPRSGWYGNEDWGEDDQRRMWENYADGADTPLAREEWLAKHRPVWMNTDLGEQTPQARECVTEFLANGEPKWPAWYRIRQCTDALVDTDLAEQPTQAKEQAWHDFPSDPPPHEARGSDEGWTTVTQGSATVM